MINRQAILKNITKIINNPFLDYYNQLKKNNTLTKSELEIIQSNKIKKLLDDASENIPFYKARLVNENLHELKGIPTLSKQELKDAGIAAVRSKRKLIKKTTSGTTGPAFMFYVDKDFFALELARNLRIFDFAQMAVGDPWVLLVPLRDKKNKSFSYLTRRLVLDAALLSFSRTPLCCPKANEEQFQPNEKIIKTFLDKIRRHHPELIYSYPSTLIALSTYIRKWGVKGIVAKKIILSGEVLTNHARRFIEETFQGEVFDLYGTTEFPAIAQECKMHNGLHVYTDSYFVEFALDNEIIVTDLENYMTPFIRYKTNDFGHSIKEKCSCGVGFPLMEITRGRVSDLIVAPNGQFLRAGFFSSLVEKNPEIKKYQIIQEQQNQLNIYVDSESLSDSRENFLIKRCREYAGDAMNISIGEIPKVEQPLKQFFQAYPMREIK
jgi:phenylacetate-CoA ligase